MRSFAAPIKSSSTQGNWNQPASSHQFSIALVALFIEKSMVFLFASTHLANNTRNIRVVNSPCEGQKKDLRPNCRAKPKMRSLQPFLDMVQLVQRPVNPVSVHVVFLFPSQHRPQRPWILFHILHLSSHMFGSAKLCPEFAQRDRTLTIKHILL